MSDNKDLQTNTRSTITKLILVCVLCIGLISSLVLIIQFFAQ